MAAIETELENVCKSLAYVIFKEIDENMDG